MLGIGLALALAGCATRPTDPAARAAFEEANDPLEPLNRNIFEFNRIVDGLFLRNVAELYRTIFPEPVRKSIRNVLNNLNQPVVFANNVLQGEASRAGRTAARFSVNSTVGLAGLLDVASGWGLPEQTGDFGQTLHVWGSPEGPYLILPVLGPSNPRDGIGMGVDSFMDPFRYVPRGGEHSDAMLARFVADGVDQRANATPQLDEIEKTSIDFYAQLRSLVRQNRAKQLGITGGAAPGSPAIDENLYQDPANFQPAPPTQ